MFVKAGWGLAGGVLLLLTIFGQRVFPVGGGSGRRASACCTARAASAPALGPIALRWILGQKPQTLRRTIGPAYFIVGVFYVALARRAGAAARRAVRAVRAFRRIDPLGVQHGAAADGSAGSISAAGCSPPSWRS